MKSRVNKRGMSSLMTNVFFIVLVVVSVAIIAALLVNITGTADTSLKIKQCELLYPDKGIPLYNCLVERLGKEKADEIYQPNDPSTYSEINANIIRNFPGGIDFSYVGGTAFDIYLDLSVLSGESVINYGIEEVLPVGWNVQSVTGASYWRQAGNVLKIIVNETNPIKNKRITYNILPPNSAQGSIGFVGSARFSPNGSIAQSDLHTIARTDVDGVSRPVTITPLTACGPLNTPDSIYQLQNDIVSTGNCFVVNADNIIINGNGKSIRGDNSGYGIKIEARKNVYVANFSNIRNFLYGIYIDSSSNVNFENMTLCPNYEKDIYCRWTSNILGSKITYSSQTDCTWLPVSFGTCPQRQTNTLTLHVLGSGTVNVSSVSKMSGSEYVGSCSSNLCTFEIDEGREVIISYPKSILWTGCPYPSGEYCQMMMNSDKEVTARITVSV